MAGEDELWQGYEEDGDPITDLGLTIRRAAAGALHGGAHMWIWRELDGRIQLLFQKRADNSMTFPGYFDISAAGHINFGEAPLHSVLRETKEELGISIATQDVHLLFVHREQLHYIPNNVIENEIQWVYGYDATSTPHFTLESSEVKSVQWFNLDDLAQLLTGGDAGVRIVPHEKSYFAELEQSLAGLKV